MLYGVVGAVVVAGAVAAYVMRPKPEPNAPVARAVAIADVRLLKDTLSIVTGGDHHAEYGLFGPGSDTPIANADSVLRATGDRVFLVSSAGEVVRADTSHHANNAFALEGLTPGVAQIWPILLRANGDSAGSKRRTVVVVSESSENVKRANEAFRAADDAMRNDSLSDVAVLQRVMQLDSLHGRVLRDSSVGRPEDLEALLAGARALVAARQHADSVVADTNLTMQARFAALQAYLQRAGEVRGGRGPTVTADSARLASLDPRPVGTVTRGAMCGGSRLCAESDALRAEVAVNQQISVTVWFARGSSPSLTFVWRREGELERSNRLPNNGAGRVFDPHTVSKPGRWDVRVLNGRNQLVFRHTFDVK
jgi:hypothetical protein